MVFCYKVITDTPRRSGNASPRKRSSVEKLPNIPSSLSQLISCQDYDDESIVDSIPEREWRLLAAIARKKEEDDEREKLADQFRKMWQKEKEERQLVETETNDQYKRYLNEKRQQERSWYEYKRMQLTADQQIRRGQLIDCIRNKDERSRELLTWLDDKKTTELIDKALEDEARCILAADRRCRLGAAEQWRKNLDLAHTQRKSRDAGKRRNNMIRNATQRLAIKNALNSWESGLLRQEVTALETARRANHAAHAALTEQRSALLAHEREKRLKRAKKLAVLTAQMREDLKSGRISITR